jgi:hypothetical protein
MCTDVSEESAALIGVDEQAIKFSIDVGESRQEVVL